jgi:hypothetical protein
MSAAAAHTDSALSGAIRASTTAADGSNTGDSDKQLLKSSSEGTESASTVNDSLSRNNSQENSNNHNATEATSAVHMKRMMLEVLEPAMRHIMRLEAEIGELKTEVQDMEPIKQQVIRRKSRKKRQSTNLGNQALLQNQASTNLSNSGVRQVSMSPDRNGKTQSLKNNNSASPGTRNNNTNNNTNNTTISMNLGASKSLGMGKHNFDNHTGALYGNGEGGWGDGSDEEDSIDRLEKENRITSEEQREELEKVRGV